jgi:cytochrome b6-f complex iron-sulfur subunit
MKQVTQEVQSRGAFLKNLGLSTSALMAFYCIGTTLTSCGSKDDDPSPGGSGTGDGISGTTTGNNINFTIDLKHNTYASLKTAGAFRVIGDVLVALAGSGSYVALSKTCTHEGTTLAFRSSSNDLFCSNHGSEFTTTGSVKKGPNTGDTIAALKAFKATLSGDGNTLTITT